MPPVYRALFLFKLDSIFQGCFTILLLIGVSHFNKLNTLNIWTV